MNVFKNAVIKKILIILMVVILINSFIMPNYVWAKEGPGETLVNALSYLVAWAGDTGIKVMQKLMMGTDDIEELNTTTNKNEYAIKYSPGLIFSNSVPALDINFISASENDNDSVSRLTLDVENKDDYIDLIKKANLTENDFTMLFQGMPTAESGVYGILEENGIRLNITADQSSWEFCNDSDLYNWKLVNLGNWGRMKDVSVILTNKPGGTLPALAEICIYFHKGNLYVFEYCNNKDTTVLKYCEKSKLVAKLSGTSGSETIELESTAYKLQPYIATWYNALRTIALIGLLSVLLYLGIRMILSSASAQDKAKYKNMMKDWIVAICIIFVLHYIMAFMLQMSSSLTEIIKGNVIKITDSTNKADELMSTVRTNLGDYKNSSGPQTFGYAVMYMTLVILTGMFTIQYLKRVVYMAFLTMIAPLIALTYPLDKVKDGKAQAFNYWVREYIFNCLIQPIHLLLYTIFIVNAMDFAKVNVLYAIVALAFMVPAEKIIKEMFGLKSSSPSSTLGAAAGGAFMMSMLNKIKNKPSKDDEAGGGKAPSGVRTASRGAIDNNNAGSNPPGNNPPGNNPPGNNPPGNNPPGNNPPNNNPPRNQNNNNSKQGNYNILRGVGEITGVNRLLSAPGTTLRGAAKKGAKVTAGLALGGLAGTTMLANEIADGHLFEDPGGALSKAGGAAVAGYAGGNALVGNAAGTIEKNVDKFRKGAMGVEAYNNQAFDKQFFNSDNYKIIAQDPTIQQEWGRRNIKEVAQTFLDNGISDQNIIRSAMQNGVNGDEYKSISSMGVTDVKHYRKVRDKNRHKGLSASQIAARMQIAKNLPDRLFNDESGFIRYAKRFGIDDENDARRLFREIDDFT